MTGRTGRYRIVPMAATAAVLLSGAACSHVSQEDLDGRLQTLQDNMSQQIDDGDQQTRDELGGRIDDLDARVEQLRTDLDALEEEFDVTVTELETALRFDVPVYFGFDDDALQAEGQEALQRFSQVAQKYYPQAQITVEGFTDPSGSAAYNKQLGMRRAETVKGALVQNGMADDRIRAVSYGEDTSRLVSPDAQGPGTEGWQNRRVVLVIDHDGTLTPSATVSDAGTS